MIKEAIKLLRYAQWLDRLFGFGFNELEQNLGKTGN